MKRFFLIVALVLLAGYLLTGVTQVRPGERAVVRRFGRVLDYKPEPGLYVGLPWGLERVDRVPVDIVRSLDVGYRPEDADLALRDGSTPAGQLLTGDHNLVNVRVVLSYSVNPDQVEDFVINTSERVDALVARAAESALMEWAASRRVDAILTSEKAQLPAWLVQATRQRLAPYRLGVTIGSVSVADIGPPDDVKQAFDRVTQAQAAQRTERNNAESRAQLMRRNALSEQVRLEQQAQSYQKDQDEKARADAEVFLKRLEQYRRFRDTNPAYLSGIWYDEMGKLFKQLRQAGRVDMLDSRLGPDGLDITIIPPLPGKK